MYRVIWLVLVKVFIASAGVPWLIENFESINHIPYSGSAAREGGLEYDGFMPIVVESGSNEPVSPNIGEKILKFEIHKAQCTTGTYRSEIVPVKQRPSREVWYSYNIFIPSDGGFDDPTWFIINQWHNHTWNINTDGSYTTLNPIWNKTKYENCSDATVGVAAIQPPVALTVKNGKMELSVTYWDKENFHYFNTTDSQPSTRVTCVRQGPHTVHCGPLAPDYGIYQGTDTANGDHTRIFPVYDIEYDMWHEFVFHIIWSWDPENPGLIEMWIDGDPVNFNEGIDSIPLTQIVRANCVRFANDVNGNPVTDYPYLKMGPYPCKWKNAAPGDTGVKRVYFDDIKMIYGSSTFEEAKPDQGSPTISNDDEIFLLGKKSSVTILPQKSGFSLRYFSKTVVGSQPVISIYNSLGKKLSPILTRNSGDWEARLENCPKGIYYYRILDGADREEGRFIITK